MSMQMDVEFKKEQIGTHFVYVGALEGGFGGWVVPHGCPSGVPLNNKTPSWHQSKVIFSAGSRFFFGPCLVFWIINFRVPLQFLASACMLALRAEAPMVWLGGDCCI